MEEKKNLLTYEGLQKLENELHDLKVVQRKEVAEKLKEARVESGYTQETVSEIIMVSRQTISNWELNETSPDLKQAKKLCDIFSISMDELSGKENVILTKLDKNESNANLIIKLIKTVGITLGTLIFILLTPTFSKLYS